MWWTGDADGNPHVGASFGWVGDYGAISYAAMEKARSRWQHAIGYGNVFIDEDGSFDIKPAPFFKDYKIIVGDHVFKSPKKSIIHKSGRK